MRRAIQRSMTPPEPDTRSENDCFPLPDDSEWQAAHGGDFITVLHNYAVVRAVGKDSRDFLTRMLSSTVAGVSPEQAEFSAWCMANGRVQGTLLLFQWQEQLCLLLPAADQAARLCSQLGKFILRSEVRFEDHSAELHCMGLAGIHSPQHIRQAFGTAPAQNWQAVSGPEASVIRLPAPVPRFLLIGAGAALTALRRDWQAHCTAAGEHAWTWLDVQAGLPWLRAACSNLYLPQFLALAHFCALDLDKGCFPGQEVIARLHHRGTVKRRLHRLYSTDRPHIGEALIPAGQQHAAGEVLEAVPDPRGGYAALAVIRDSEAAHPLHLQEAPMKAVRTEPVEAANRSGQAAGR